METKLDKRVCDYCPLAHFDREGCTVTTCNWPMLNVDPRCRTNHPYGRKIEPIKGVRFRQPSNSPLNLGYCTNLMYRPLIQGGIAYRGVYKIVPLDFPPNDPVLARPGPVRPTDFKGMTVYCRPCA
ncbi:uncharacterized protein LOC108623791 [Ceratina calcarata]|uniref:Uncharacterized protein LOC108623791 n=1 Tax=Ceratina calcarata TaxID=156304 RepID=A0AAJ7IWE9_9HYME|nr:uncharacterized protein LOC108623791 [Ceratina calcarata]